MVATRRSGYVRAGPELGLVPGKREGKRRKDPKLNSRSDQSWGPGGMKAKLENEVNMDLKSSKISPREPQHETNMDPKCTPKGALEASNRPLGAESGFR